MIDNQHIKDMPAAEYHALPFLSSSMLKALANSCPATLRYKLDNPATKDEFDFGSVAHTVILEPEKVTDTVSIIWYENFRTKEARDQRDDARIRNLIPILEHDFHAIMEMRKSIEANGHVIDLLHNISVEQTYLWYDDMLALDCRCRCDGIKKGKKRDTIIDYKTCTNLKKFPKHMFDFGYHMQAAWYQRGYKYVTGREADFVFIAQEKTPPYLCNIYTLSEHALSCGDFLNMNLASIYRECLEHHTWPSYSPICVEIPDHLANSIDKMFNGEQDEDDNLPF